MHREAEGRLLLGIEIGGTKLQLALGSGPRCLDAIERRTAEPSRGASGLLDQVADGLETLLARTGRRLDELDAVGIGFGGPVDAAAGRVVVSHQVEGWAGFPLADWARDRTGCPRVALGNDADAAALAEALQGAGEGLSPVLYVNSGSGIGGGLIVDGRIYSGGSGLGALEVGHLRIDGLDPVTDDSATASTLEALASGWAIGRRAVGPGHPPLPVPEVARRADAGDPLALEALRIATVAMGRGLAHAVTLLAPRRVVLGGGVSLLPDRLWLDPIRAQLDRRVFPPFRGTYDLRTALLGEQVVLHGALALADSARAIPDRG